MHKLIGASIAVLALLLSTAAWAGGGHHVSGEVDGIWTAGDSVYVDGPCIVPGGKGLLIEPGVTIVIQCTDPFVVEGHLQAVGTEMNPIILIPPENWRGFSFARNESVVQVLQYVIIPENAPVPSNVVVSDAAALRIEHCALQAYRSCLDVTGGFLWASYNYVIVEGIYAHAVQVHHLRNELNGCTNPFGNHLTSNIIKADVPDLGSPLPPSSEFTAGLYIDGSTNLCLWDNTISVIAPGSTIGAYFGEDAQNGSAVSALDSCIITVKSRDGSPKGVYNANQGGVRVRRCVVDVAEVNPDNISRSAGIIASLDARVDVNSTSVTVDRDTLWFVAISGGTVTIDFATRWSSSAGTIIGGGDARLALSLDDGSDPLTSVTYGSHIWTADPLLLRQGEWGAWRDSVQIHDYYGIPANSPCIDNGDVTYGYDPDNTLPDIGRFYYPQQSNAAGEPVSVASNVRLLPAYPNPFNSTTTVPYVIDHAGVVSVTVYGLNGRRVATLVSGRAEAGEHSVAFSTDRLASGTYLVRLQLNGETRDIGRLIYIK